MAYCFDTSSFIECWTRSYPIDVFSSLWERLDALAESGDLVSPREVLTETEKKEDELSGWIKARPYLLVELDDDVQDAARTILSAHPLLVKALDRRTEADPFVIAVAQVRGLTVVTQENFGSDDRPRIPDVCNALDLRCIKVVEFIREQGWTF